MLVIEEMPNSGEPKSPTLEEPIKYCPWPDKNKLLNIGRGLPNEVEEELANFLKMHQYIFAWQLKDMPGIPEDIDVHKLNIDPEVKVVQQRNRTYALERRAAAEEEVKKLLQAGFIKES